MIKSAFASLLFICACNISFGQKVIMMGRVWDEQGKPISGAELKLAGSHSSCTVISDDKGVYNSKPMDPGPYKVFITVADKKWFVAERPKLAKPCQFPEFYNFVVTHDHVELRTDHGKDPDMLARLEKVEQSYDASNPRKDKKK